MPFHLKQSRLRKILIKILELREKTKKKLDNQFDLREFHNVVLKNGAVALDILEEIVDDYIRVKRVKE